MHNTKLDRQIPEESRIRSSPCDLWRCRHRRERGIILGRFGRVLLLSGFAGLSSQAGGCSAIDRLSTIGEKPALSSIDNPTTEPGYKPVQMPMPPPQPAS